MYVCVLSSYRLTDVSSDEAAVAALARLTCIEADTSKYSCFNLSSLPASVESSGYKTLVIDSAVIRADAAASNCPELCAFKSKTESGQGDACHKRRVATVLVLCPGTPGSPSEPTKAQHHRHDHTCRHTLYSIPLQKKSLKALALVGFVLLLCLVISLPTS